jgi:uncharacterized repeat protein (TIGR02543 family)
MGLTFDNSGNLYFADYGNHCIRKIDATTGTLTTVAGDTNAGDHGDGGQATLAKLNGPTDVVIDNAGNLYIADKNNHRIRKVDNSGTITTIAGDGNAGYKDSTLATVAQFNNPWSLAPDNESNLVISDTGNHLLRKVGTPPPGNEISDTTDCNLVTEIWSAQCYALIALYDSLEGDNWTLKDGWKTTNTPCSWAGITCTDSDVTAINLNGNQLTGTLPNLSAFAGLTSLDLGNNQLSGPITTISTLPNLQTVQLENNQLQGSVPDTSGLTQLQTLALTGNDQVCRDPNHNYGSLDLNGLVECPAENQLPTATFTATPAEGQAPLTVQLDGSASFDPYGLIASYHWTISDGRTFNGVAPTITFDKSGAYEITLIVKDNHGDPSINQAKHAVTITAAVDQQPLTIAKGDNGQGTITVRQNGAVSMLCRTDCPQESLDYPMGSEVKLRASAANGSTFTGWTGDCTGTERYLTLTMDSHKTCTANFQLDAPTPAGMYTLTVNTIGTLGGTGSLEINDENCGTECVGNYRGNQHVKLTAVPSPHAHFARWSQDCEEIGQDPTIEVTMTADKYCTAVFGSDSDKAAEQMTQELQEVGELNTGEKLTEVFPSNLNYERLLEAYRLAEKAMMVVEENFILTQTWPYHFKVVENWFQPMPEYLYTKKIRIMHGGENIGNYHVEGEYIRVDVLLVDNQGVEELLPILVYYNEEPIITSTLPGQLSPRICKHRIR